MKAPDIVRGRYRDSARSGVEVRKRRSDRSVHRPKRVFPSYVTALEHNTRSVASSECRYIRCRSHFDWGLRQDADAIRVQLGPDQHMVLQPTDCCTVTSQCANHLNTGVPEKRPCRKWLGLEAAKRSSYQVIAPEETTVVVLLPCQVVIAWKAD